MTEPRDLYFVAMKVLLRDGDKLLITHDVFGQWDIPGGRIKKYEFDAPLESVIERKMHEELGDIKYELGDPKVFFRVERLEYSTQSTVRIFAVGYEAQYLGGEIKLGEHHDKYEWVDLRTFSPDDYFEGGWLTGIKDYQNHLKR
jgi:8-oxo-dGTP pyrophosphatase MutT (NUDIX family)